ncbi:hypothetical protein DFH06DRAFT_989472, partial [Mycena polygramma]
LLSIARERFFHFHGEKTARLSNYHSVYDDGPKRSLLIKILSPLLFNAPILQLRAFESANTDQLINYLSWQRLITSLRSQWQDLVLYGSLILNTNVGFLALPATVASTAGQIASCASICFGLGSIILVCLFVCCTLEMISEPYPQALFFQYHGESTYGLEMLAIVHSLPYALMVWGMIMFILAFLLTIFQTSGTEEKRIILATVLTVFVAIMGFVWTEKRFSWKRKTDQLWLRVKTVGFKMWTSCRSRWAMGEKDTGAV